MSLDKRQKIRRVAFDAAFLALALILSYVEALFPISMLIPLPGFKLGLANAVVLWLAVKRGMFDACAVSLVRVAVVAMLFGTPVSFWFSFGGAVCSLLILAVLRKTHMMSYVGVSVLSASCHQVGQLMAASVFFGIKTVFSYLPLMLVAAVIFGALCGLLLNTVAPRIERGGRMKE